MQSGLAQASAVVSRPERDRHSPCVWLLPAFFIEGLHKLPVPPFSHQLQRRAAISPCDPECGQQQQSGNHKVLPAVERPLAVPGELHGVGERLEVRDGPLVAVGTASADEVAQQVKVEADKDQEGGQPWMSGQGTAFYRRAEGEVSQWAGDKVSGKGTHQRKGQSVQRMVIP